MTKRICLLAVALTAAFLLAVPSAQAAAPDCRYACGCSASCAQLCWDYEILQIVSCEQWGICAGSQYCNQCSCSGATQGSSGPDTLYGSAADDCMDGNAGDDTLYGSSGEDDLFGDTGDDTLYGGSGNDCLDGGLGSDNLRGDTGHDLCYNGEFYVSCND